MSCCVSLAGNKWNFDMVAGGKVSVRIEKEDGTVETRVIRHDEFFSESLLSSLCMTAQPGHGRL